MVSDFSQMKKGQVINRANMYVAVDKKKQFIFSWTLTKQANVFCQGAKMRS